jgi:phosphatidate phosphatase PAH1
MRFRSPKTIHVADLELQLTQSKNYGIVTLSVNESEEITFDGYAPEIKVETLYMNDVDIKEGWNTIKVQVKGKNPQATNYVFGLDYLKVK